MRAAEISGIHGLTGSGAEVFPPPCQVRWRTLFGHVASGTGLDETHGVLIFRVNAEDQYRQLWFFCMDLLEDINTAHVRHGNVEQNHIAGNFAYLAQCINAAVSFGHHAHFAAFLNDLFQPVTDDGMVVGNQDANHISSPLLFPAASGNITVTHSPPPGGLSNLIWPSSCVTRSRMPRMP